MAAADVGVVFAMVVFAMVVFAMGVFAMVVFAMVVFAVGVVLAVMKKVNMIGKISLIVMTLLLRSVLRI